jgi:hypothetical protein
MSIIGFFSSDARSLYLDDVYRVLALPNGYTIKFRYQKQYITDSLVNDLNKIRDKEGIVFFTQGNDIKLDKEKRPIQNFSLRKVIVKDILDDENTQLVYFYLSLGDFVDYNINIENKENLPPYKFVSEISGSFGTTTKWIDRVEQIKQYFGNVLFLNASGFIDKSGKEAPICYSPEIKESYYNLYDESEYSVKIMAYEPKYDDSKGNNAFDIEQDMKYITINKPKKLSIGAVKDFTTINITTHTLDINQAVSYFKIFTESSDSNHIYDILLKVYLNRKKNKSMIFGALSLAAAFGLFLGQFATRLTNVQGVSKVSIVLLMLFASAIIGFASTSLYKYFNKK